MPYKPKRGIIERTASSLGLIPKLDDDDAVHNLTTTGSLARYPSPDQWHDVVELDLGRLVHNRLVAEVPTDHNLVHPRV